MRTVFEVLEAVIGCLAQLTQFPVIHGLVLCSTMLAPVAVTALHGGVSQGPALSAEEEFGEGRLHLEGGGCSEQEHATVLRCPEARENLARWIAYGKCDACVRGVVDVDWSGPVGWETKLNALELEVLVEGSEEVLGGVGGCSRLCPGRDVAALECDGGDLDKDIGPIGFGDVPPNDGEDACAGRDGGSRAEGEHEVALLGPRGPKALHASSGQDGVECALKSGAEDVGGGVQGRGEGHSAVRRDDLGEGRPCASDRGSSSAGRWGLGLGGWSGGFRGLLGGGCGCSCKRLGSHGWALAFVSGRGAGSCCHGGGLPSRFHSHGRAGGAGTGGSGALEGFGVGRLQLPRGHGRDLSVRPGMGGSRDAGRGLLSLGEIGGLLGQLLA